MKKNVEICCGSYYDAYQAYLGGAKRVELNSALYIGGLTPSIGALRLTKQNTDLQVIAMVRERGAGFCYNSEDFAAMLEDTSCLLKNGADGIAFGCLNEHGEIHLEQTKAMLYLIHQAGKEAVFHRAFDCVSDPYQAMEILIELGVHRVLTSGLQPKAIQGKAMIKELQTLYGDAIEILAGSGIHAANAKQLMQDTGIHQVHSSCKDWLTDPTTSGANVTYAYEEAHPFGYDAVRKELVAELIAAVQ